MTHVAMFLSFASVMINFGLDYLLVNGIGPPGTRRSRRSFGDGPCALVESIVTFC